MGLQACTRDHNFAVLDEAIVSAFGLSPGTLYTSVKGDPTLRETVPLRPRQESRIDRHAEEVLAACEWLLRKSGCYSVYIGFNSSEVRTESVFNPFNYEIHDAEALISEGYMARHFVRIPYQEKMRTISRVRGIVQKGSLRSYLPSHWRLLMDQQRDQWQPLAKQDIRQIMHAFSQLRVIEGYYLRSAAISLSQRIVRASFNCDGTYIIEAAYFPDFVRQSMP